MKKLTLAIALIASLAFTGCSLFKAAPVPADKLAQYVQDAKDIGEASTVVTLLEEPNAKPKLEKAVEALTILEQQPDAVTIDQLTKVVQDLPIAKLQSAKAKLYILAGRLILRRVTGDVELANITNLKPIATGLREGIQAGMSQ